MAEGPWTKYQQQSAEAAGPWTKYQAAPPAESPTEQPDQGGLSISKMVQPLKNVGPDIGQEFSQGTAEVRKGESNLLGPGKSVLERAKGAGQIAGGAFQQAFSPVSGSVRAIVSDPIRQTGLPGSQFAAKTADVAGGFIGPGALVKGGRAAIEAAPGIARGVSQIGERVAETAPKIARTASLSQVAPEALAAGKASRAAADAERAQRAEILRTAPKTVDDAKKVATALYGQAAEEGGSLSPAFTDKFLDEAGKTMPQTAAGKLIRGEDKAASLVQRMEGLRGKPLSLAEAQEIDEGLGDLVDSEYTVHGISKEGLKIQRIQHQFRDMIDNAKAPEIEGGKNGFQALKDARLAWAQAAKMRDIERIAARAQMMEQPVTGIRTGLRNILTNKEKLRGYTKEEQAALSRAAETGVITGIQRMVGSRLTAIAAAAAGHGIPGAIAHGLVGHTASTMARRAATASQLKKLEGAMQVIGSRIPKPKSDLEALSNK